MRKIKYQIFVSSTYEDLIEERNIVIKAILEMGHFPVGMEMFSAADEEQWEIIKKQIDDSDYYVVIVAHRYGSRVGAISYTEREYDYAVEKGIPVLGFVISDKAKWPTNMIEEGEKAKIALKKFKIKVKKKMATIWNSRDELHGKVAIALGKIFTTNPSMGWIRAIPSLDVNVTSELSRLSKENAELRSVNDSYAQKTRDEAARLEEEQKALKMLRNKSETIGVWYEGDSGWTSKKTTTLYKIFYYLAYSMTGEHGKSTKEAAVSLGVQYGGIKKARRAEWAVPKNSIEKWFAYLNALGLVCLASRKTQRAEEECWKLTELGMSVYRTILLSELAVKKTT
jgi:hypothetical protein